MSLIPILGLLSLVSVITPTVAQAQVASMGTCYTFNRNLGEGKPLSATEAQALATALVNAGVWTSGTPITTYNDNVASAVTAFQQKYAAQILTPNGLSYGTGYVGAATRAQLNAMYPCATTQPSQSAGCPTGYTCTPVTPVSTACPVGYTCTPTSSTTNNNDPFSKPICADGYEYNNHGGCNPIPAIPTQYPADYQGEPANQYPFANYPLCADGYQYNSNDGCVLMPAPVTPYPADYQGAPTNAGAVSSFTVTQSAIGSTVLSGGQVQAPIIAVTLQAPAIPVIVNRINLDLGSLVNINAFAISKVYLVDASTNATLSSVPLNSSTVVQSGSNYLVAFPVNFDVPANTTKQLIVRADVAPNSPATTINVSFDANSIFGIDVNGVSEAGPSYAIGQQITIR